MNENEILRSINKKCGEAQILELFYYNKEEKHDKCLGKLIFDLVLEKENKCEKCKFLNMNHFYYIYKNNGRIKINFTQDETTDKLLEYICETSTFSSPIKNSIK